MSLPAELNELRYLNTTDAAAFLGVDEGTLRNWRGIPGQGPEYSKCGDSDQSTVRYGVPDLIRFMEAKKVDRSIHLTFSPPKRSLMGSKSKIRPAYKTKPNTTGSVVSVIA